ncbi:laccase [Sparassis latifolia]|uniref:laccase n=1 Tax=Sparassis crispa TaxID=139825 RepID=A0A401GAD9_9APHY|nr:Laccase [Sparassis crispa]GBE79135.1 Laccase [Sparassis crispa]
MRFFFSAFLTLGFSARALGHIGPITELPIVNAAVAPNGVLRNAVLAGGTFPGPVIAGNKGDNFFINVVDRLTNETMLTSTSIHWHGINQHTTNWADGPAFVTQCPIVSGNSFLYNFRVPDQAGTFWYHSHLETQYCDGLRGPFIVYDPDDPHAGLYDIDDDSTIITLADWYNEAAVFQPPIAISDATLINGLVPNNYSDAAAVFTVVRGLRYRFRLISISCSPDFTFSIDGHNMTVIEADGDNTQPLNVDSIQIYAAQRYSFVLEANQPVENYWIRANASLGPAGSAILRYVGAPPVKPTTTASPSVNPLEETNLHALTNAQAPGAPNIDGADILLNLNFTFNTTEFLVNGVTFVPPTVPVLLQILNGSYTAQELLPHGSVYTLPRNKTVQITMPGGVLGIPHPLHLHGHSFSVIRSAGSNQTNYVNPVRRDTVNIGLQGDNVTIRFDTNNPGPWFLHCHIDFHLKRGFAIVLAEDTYDTPRVDAPPPEWSQLCPSYDASPQSDQSQIAAEQYMNYVAGKT